MKEKGGQVYSVSDRAVVAEALAELGTRNIGALIVLDGHRQVRGIISTSRTSTPAELQPRCLTEVSGLSI